MRPSPEMGTNSSRDGDPRLSTGATSSRARCRQGQPEHAEPTPLPAPHPNTAGLCLKAPRGDSTLRGLIQGDTGTNSAIPNPAKQQPGSRPRPSPQELVCATPPRACPTGDPGPHPGQTLSHGQGPPPPHSRPHPRMPAEPPVPARSPRGAGGRGAARGGGREKAENAERGFIESQNDPARFRSD